MEKYGKYMGRASQSLWNFDTSVNSLHTFYQTIHTLSGLDDIDIIWQIGKAFASCRENVCFTTITNSKLRNKKEINIFIFLIGLICKK